MKKTILLLLFLLSAFFFVNAQEKNDKLYGVGFYNLENLFDTIHNDGKNDYEFLPEGKFRWGTLKYINKVKNIAQVLNDMGADVLSSGMAVVGVSEVENGAVLNDLVKNETLASRGWQYIHIEGPDKRGIDCALLYNPKLFKPIDSKLIPYTTESNPNSSTRGFLVVSGKMAEETVHIIVNHWPSRFSKSPVREQAGVLVRQLKDSLLMAVPESKVIIMGDMNDNPNDKSVNISLGAVGEKKAAKRANDLYNPWWNIWNKDTLGTLKYRGKWMIFDQIILSGNMVAKKRSKLNFYKAEVFSRNYLFQQDGRYKGEVKRTHAGGMWLDGYSDHLPVIVYLISE